MSPLLAVIVLETLEFSLEIARAPEGYLIEEFPSDCLNQAFNEGMGQGHIRYGLNLIDIENPEIGLLLAILE
jgi:hypothetical protein